MGLLALGLLTPGLLTLGCVSSRFDSIEPGPEIFAAASNRLYKARSLGCELDQRRTVWTIAATTQPNDCDGQQHGQGRRTDHQRLLAHRCLVENERRDDAQDRDGEEQQRPANGPHQGTLVMHSGHCPARPGCVDRREELTVADGAECSRRSTRSAGDVACGGCVDRREELTVADRAECSRRSTRLAGDIACGGCVDRREVLTVADRAGRSRRSTQRTAQVHGRHVPGESASVAR